LSAPFVFFLTLLPEMGAQATETLSMAAVIPPFRLPALIPSGFLSPGTQSTKRDREKPGPMATTTESRMTQQPLWRVIISLTHLFIGILDRLFPAYQLRGPCASARLARLGCTRKKRPTPLRHRWRLGAAFARADRQSRRSSHSPIHSASPIPMTKSFAHHAGDPCIILVSRGPS